MSKQDLINQGKVVYENIKAIDSISIKNNPGGLQPWNNMDFDDFVDLYDSMLKTLNSIYKNNVLDHSTYSVIANINNILNNVLKHCNAFSTNRDQGHFQNAFSQVDSLLTHVQQWGLKYEAVLGNEIVEKSELIDKEITNLLSSKTEIAALKDSVNSLIEPAVAGSLSKSFSDRKDSLNKNQDRWFWSSVILAIASIVSTVAIVWSIVGVFSNTEVLDAIQNTKDGFGEILWPTIILRVGILLPVYSVFIFCFLQYKKERDLEEEYAHKAAVATSLPNYGGLAVENDVKDQILSEASKVIFTSPTLRKAKESKSETTDISNLNKLFTNLQKFIPKGNE